MAETIRIGLIGTGKKKERGDATGYAMAYQHAAAYRAVPGCEMVACADISQENADAFAEANEVRSVYLDYREMLEREKLDVVSICTWPRLHAEMIVAAAQAGVRLIYSEKPMADTWGGARRSAEECERRGVVLCFNHQRRFGLPFRGARGLLKEGAIGQLQRLECSCGDIYDYGTHYIDMFGFYNDDVPAEWVIAQIDYRQEKFVFGATVENQAIGYWKYRNGVFGLIATGAGSAGIGVHNRLIGSDGVIEVGVNPDGPTLRVRRKGSGDWEVIDTGSETLHGPNYIHRAIADAIDALRTGREPEMSARRALNATEIIFACYESSRRRGRVDLPLTIEDNPLQAMVESGELRPEASARTG